MRPQAAQGPPPARKKPAKTQKLRRIRLFQVALFHVVATCPLSAEPKRVLNTIPKGLIGELAKQLQRLQPAAAHTSEKNRWQVQQFFPLGGESQ
ncbi:hypothetical protein [Hydrogenophaga sp.]|uniref:hypothetical protein n=1 Tax=Hydrogenophaga sp. TaxID=1904254 RepID=UPI00286D7298|nr:hypothetical protein [Hydrogenophaga sp.]